jgi:hypothetical protein
VGSFSAPDPMRTERLKGMSKYKVACDVCDVSHYVAGKDAAITMVTEHAQNGCRKMVGTPYVRPEGMHWVA